MIQRTLEQWKEAATNFVKAYKTKPNTTTIEIIKAEKILALIELVEKKDELNRQNLHRLITLQQLRPVAIMNKIIDYQNEALALTDSLGSEEKK